MRLTEIIWPCKGCRKEFRVFSDDGATDETVCWNWCPHCGMKNNIWVRIHVPELNREEVPVGIGGEEATKKFGVKK